MGDMTLLQSISEFLENFTVLKTKLYPHLVYMLLYVINVVTTELMAPSLMKPTGSFDVKKKHREKFM